MYLAIINGLKYDIYAIGKDMGECKNNLLIAFQRYIEQCGCSIEQWVEDEGEDFSSYNNNTHTFLLEYYGCRFYDITKGYAFGWE